MRAEYTLALRRESEEFERALVEQRVDKTFEEFYELLAPATDYLRTILDRDGTRVLDELERAYLQAIEYAARLAIGCQVVPRTDAARDAIPTAPIYAPVVERAASPDQVINVRPCG